MIGMAGDFDPAPKEPLPPATFRAGEFIGHRVWIVSRSLDPNVPPSLYSFVMNCLWQPGVPMRDTTKDNRISIEDHNTAGVWAFKEQSRLFADFLCGWEDLAESIAIGTIFMWGTVIEHDHGYRSQYASIRSIERVVPGWRFCPADEVLRKLNEIYLPTRQR
jgi:hypothetical protein